MMNILSFLIKPLSSCLAETAPEAYPSSSSQKLVGKTYGWLAQQIFSTASPMYVNPPNVQASYSQQDGEKIDKLWEKASLQTQTEEIKNLNLSEGKKILNAFLEKPVLNNRDVKIFLDMLTHLVGKIESNASKELDPSTNEKLLEMIDMMIQSRKVVIKHGEAFSPEEHSFFCPIFYQTFHVNGKKFTISRYQWAKHLKGLAPLFIGGLEGCVLQDSLFAEQFKHLKAYIETGALPKKSSQLFDLFKVADMAGYTALQNVGVEKILENLDEEVNSQLIDYALDCSNKALAIKCLPHFIANKDPQKMVNLFTKMKEIFSKEWILDIEDLSCVNRLLEIQYENGVLDLYAISALVEQLKPFEGINIYVRGNNSTLQLRLSKPLSLEMLHNLSKMKIIKSINISLRSLQLRDWQPEIIFPHIEQVCIESYYRSRDPSKVESLVKVFPNAKNYTVFAMNDSEAETMLHLLVRKDLTSLKVEGSHHVRITDKTAFFVADQFKHLNDFQHIYTSITSEGVNSIRLKKE